MSKTVSLVLDDETHKQFHDVLRTIKAEPKDVLAALVRNYADNGDTRWMIDQETKVRKRFGSNPPSTPPQPHKPSHPQRSRCRSPFVSISINDKRSPQSPRTSVCPRSGYPIRAQ